MPFVIKTKPQSKSLNEIPFGVPPQAKYSNSTTSLGTASLRTSCWNALRVKCERPAPADRLNACRKRQISASDTKIIQSIINNN